MSSRFAPLPPMRPAVRRDGWEMVGGPLGYGEVPGPFSRLITGLAKLRQAGWARTHRVLVWLRTRPPEAYLAAIMVTVLALFAVILFTGSTGVGRGGR